jgi:hypothetical protein
VVEVRLLKSHLASEEKASIGNPTGQRMTSLKSIEDKEDKTEFVS